MVRDGNWTCADQFTMYVNVESLCCTPETNIILYVYYTSIKNKIGISLVIQWVRLCTRNAGSLGSIPDRGTRSHMPDATKSSHAATKRSHMQQLRPGAA